MDALNDHDYDMKSSIHHEAYISVQFHHDDLLESLPFFSSHELWTVTFQQHVLHPPKSLKLLSRRDVPGCARSRSVAAFSFRAATVLLTHTLTERTTTPAPTKLECTVSTLLTYQIPPVFVLILSSP